jgi:hypothetical protein
MEEQNGNVGPNTITQNQSGSGFISEVWNPRPAAGYQAAEGSDASDLEVAKEAGVVSLRTGTTAASVEEVEVLTTTFSDSTGATPFTRALGIEEGYGVKTIEIVVVGAGGVAATSTQISELEEYFNGDLANKIYGVLVMNNQATAVNFTAKPISVTATVYGGNKTSVETALTGLLNPEATDDDGNYIWDYGEEVPISVIISTIMNSEPAPSKTVVTVPAADVTLAKRELPTTGTLSITIV